MATHTFKPIELKKKGVVVKGGEMPEKREVDVLEKQGDYTKSKTMKKEEKKEKKQGFFSKAMDVISAPLSQPKTTFTKGIKAGAEEVKKSREEIEGGNVGEAMKVMGTTALSTAVAAGGVLGGAALFGGGAAASTAPVIEVSSATMNAVRTRLAFAKLTGEATKFAPSIKNIGTTAATWGGRYASNSKTASLTKKLLIASGISLGVASIAKDLLGTYPFASFGKEETLQSTSFVMTQAINAGLYEEAQGILNASNEIVNATPTLIDKIPYANVQKEFKRYAEEQKKNNLVWQEIINKKIAEQGQESDFARERRESDEAAFDRKREFADEESDRYKQIEEEKAAKKEQDKQDELEEMRWKAEYYNLLRDGKYEEAEQLLNSK